MTKPLRPMRRAQNMAARVIIVLSLALAAYMVAGTASARPQDSNATLPPYQRCDLISRIAYTAVQARDIGITRQDLHLKLDYVDPYASLVIDRVYGDVRYAGLTPGDAQEAALEACTRVLF